MDILDYTIGTGGMPTDSEAHPNNGASAPKPNLRIRTPKEDYDEYYDEDDDDEINNDLENGFNEKDWISRKAAIAISNADASNVSPYFTVPVILLFLYIAIFKDFRIEPV